MTYSIGNRLWSKSKSKGKDIDCPSQPLRNGRGEERRKPPSLSIISAAPKVLNTKDSSIKVVDWDLGIVVLLMSLFIKEPGYVSLNGGVGRPE